MAGALRHGFTPKHCVVDIAENLTRNFAGTSGGLGLPWLCGTGSTSLTRELALLRWPATRIGSGHELGRGWGRGAASEPNDGR
jgi:hypothetical protein